MFLFGLVFWWFFSGGAGGGGAQGWVCVYLNSKLGHSEEFTIILGSPFNVSTQK